ncbi:MAG TPA: tRNA lysidine(34) synthetase TilS [Verrucomicrobiales bacterium]|nr:tRNA lysidine(34) synthetase TilS [Verrucomicrobiales bacterium]
MMDRKRRGEAEKRGDAFGQVCDRIATVLGEGAERKRHLAAVSGGVDSMVMLHALRAGPGWRRIIVAHVDHGLRGRASGADAAFVRGEAAKLEMEFELVKVDARGLAQEERLSLEAAARKARYAALAGVARRRRCPRVLLAHQADDQVETVLMNLFRGAGVRGLGGMRTRSERMVDGVRLELIRPLLGMWREEISAAAREQGLRFREDASNANSAFFRNRIRRELLPEIEKCCGRDVRPMILRTARQAAEETLYFEDLLKDQAEEAELSVKRLRAMHPALLNRLLLAWLVKRGVKNLGRRLVESLRDLVPEGAERAVINLPGGGAVRRRSGKLFVERPSRRSNDG